jgi:fucose 4-O-acetylase-like acetyltransferase
MSRTSIAIVNLRAFAILVVVSFHATLAYLATQTASSLPFDHPPYDWRAIPILDDARWFGFDLVGAFQYVFLMPFFFLLSGLFVWSSLKRKGVSEFLVSRLLRLGVPFVLAVCLLMPLAIYPAYSTRAIDPSWSAYWTQLMALPFWPDGPLWFLWQILLLDLAAAALFRFAPHFGEMLGQLSINAGESPGRYFVGFAIVSALAYLPLAAIFKPWDWSQFGPFSFQPSRLLHYCVYFFAGLGIGVNGIERGLLSASGMLTRRWVFWLGVALAAFLAWMGFTALTMGDQGSRAAFQPASDIAFALSSAASCFALAAIFLRFATRRIPVADSLSQNAYVIYLVHYPVAIWLQFLLLGLARSGVTKGAIVFAGTLTVSWLAAIALRHIPLSGLHLLLKRRPSGRVAWKFADPFNGRRNAEVRERNARL